MKARRGMIQSFFILEATDKATKSEREMWRCIKKKNQGTEMRQAWNEIKVDGERERERWRRLRWRA